MVTERDVNPAARRAAEVDRSRPREAAPVRRPEHEEDWITRSVEHQAAKIPSTVFLTLAMAAAFASLGLELAGRQRASRFVGMWPPTLLTMGVYNKLVKLLGAS